MTITDFATLGIVGMLLVAIAGLRDWRDVREARVRTVVDDTGRAYG